MSDTPVEATEPPPPPPELGDAGAALWRRLHAGIEYDEHEVVLVLLACTQQDDVARLEELLEVQGLVVTGSTGQPRLSPVLAELRQSRLAVAKLLGSLAFPASEDDRPLTPRQLQGRRAAEKRWNAHRERTERAPAR